VEEWLWCSGAVTWCFIRGPMRRRYGMIEPRPPSAWPSDSASGAEPPDPHMPEIAFRNEARLRDPKPLSAAACRLFTQHTAGSRLCDALETWTLQDFSTTPHLNIHDRLPARCLQVAGIAIDDFHSGSRCVGGFARA
jgi:hypothetical protein